jgi:hypothetical protein
MSRSVVCISPVGSRDLRRSDMKAAILFLVLINSAFGQVTQSTKAASEGLRVEARTSSSRVQMTGEIVLTVFFP